MVRGVCGDFRRLNSVTKLDQCPLSALTTFNEQLAECTIFSKVDLKHAFQQVCVDESSQDKTAIITTLGLFRFLRMPYGLKHAAQCFQQNVHQLLKDLPFAHFRYMDDIIVGSRNKEDHMGDLRDLFQHWASSEQKQMPTRSDNSHISWLPWSMHEESPFRRNVWMRSDYFQCRQHRRRLNAF